MPDYIKHTQTWLSSVVIALGLCPFAKLEFDSGNIAYRVVETGELQGQLEQIILECAAMDTGGDRDTSLIIFPKGLSDFAKYLDMISLANALLAEQQYEGIYQLASFHPAYCFADVALDDPSHYTNRSPYPMVHVLREVTVTAALKTYPNPENIPERNIMLTRELGTAAMQSLLAKCYK
jgi:hypothetical protein